MQVPVLLHPTALIILVQANEMPYVPMNHDCGRWFEKGKNPSSCRYSHHCTILYPYLYIYIYVHYDFVKYTNIFVNLLQHFLEAPTHTDTRTHANAHIYYICIWYLSIDIFSTSLALPCKVFSHIWDVYPMEDLNWKLVLLRFVWVLGQQPCWSPAMCLQAFSVFVWDRWGCNVLRHQTKGPKNPMALRDFKTSFFWNQAGMDQRNHFSTLWLGFSLERPSSNPCVRNQKPMVENFWWTQVMTDDKQLPLRKLGTFLHNHIWWTVMVCLVFDGHRFPAKYYSCNRFFCHVTSLHFLLYIYIHTVYRYFCPGNRYNVPPHQIASESHWINWIFFSAQVTSPFSWMCTPPGAAPYVRVWL